MISHFSYLLSANQISKMNKISIIWESLYHSYVTLQTGRLMKKQNDKSLLFFSQFFALVFCVKNTI